MTHDARPAFWGSGATQLDDWLAIEPDGTIVVYSGKVELGTGVRTALAQIVAEELDVPVTRIRMVMGDTARTPNEGYTAGSKTIQMGGAALRSAAAEARQALLEMAAGRFEAPQDVLVVRAGTIAVRENPSRSVTYAELMGGRRFNRLVTGAAPRKAPSDYTIVGTDAPRLDLLAKFTGQPSFVHNLRLPDMLHARVVRPPSPGATLVSLDESVAQGVRVVRRGGFVAVVAEREFQAIQAARQLQEAGTTWQETARLPPLGELYDWLRAQPTADRVVAESGAVETGLHGATRSLEATYRQPFHAHAAIGPSCAVAQWQDGTLTVWCSSQGVFQLRGALADLLELPVERIHVIYLEGAGCYGQNGHDDVAADAALLARELAGQWTGRPVRVQWSREDEFAWEPKGPAMVMQVHGALDEQGRIAGWDYHAWSPPHGNRPRTALNLLAGQLLREQPAPPNEFFLGGDRNAATNYTLPNSRVTLHWLSWVPLRWSSFRSLGATANTFANESFMDELAAAAGADPLAFRLRHLDDPRGRDVLAAAAKQAGWGTPLPDGEGRGIAYAQYENREAYVATVAQVRVDRGSGALRVLRVVVAHDCGLIINPNGVRNQIEGNVIQATSRALKEEVRFDGRRITSLDWDSYPILTFAEVPGVEIVLLNRPDQPAVGAGEPATITTAPAIANGIFAATGARVRQVPFTPERVRAALAALPGA